MYKPQETLTASRPHLAQYLLMLMLLVAGGLALTGCNTASGFGQDVEATGEEISETAQDVEEDIED